MTKQKLDKIEILFDNTGKAHPPVVRFQDVDVELRPDGRGFIFNTSSKTPSAFKTKAYKLVKLPDHILLKVRITGVPEKGIYSRIMNTRSDGYKDRFPYYGQKADVIRELYGTMFSCEAQTDGDIKLFPILIEEVKQVRVEILDAIKRYETENDLIRKNNEI